MKDESHEPPASFRVADRIRRIREATAPNAARSAADPHVFDNSIDVPFDNSFDNFTNFGDFDNFGNS